MNERGSDLKGEKPPDGNPPLWLPVGSVRAMVFLGLIATAAYMALSGYELPAWLEDAVALMIGIYFGSRAKN